MYRTMLSLKGMSITLPTTGPLVVIAVTIAIDLASRRALDIGKWPVSPRWGMYYVAVVLICSLFIWNADEGSVYARQFIHFKF